MNWQNHYWVVGGDDTRVWSSASAGFVPADDETFVAWHEAGNHPQRIASLAELRDVFAQSYPAGMLITYAAAKRWEAETRGTTVSGLPVSTDDRSKQMLMGARIAADADATFTTRWVGSDGSITLLNAAQIVGLSNAVLAHVDGCFDTFSTIVSGINATPPTITTHAQIDAAFAA